MKEVKYSGKSSVKGRLPHLKEMLGFREIFHTVIKINGCRYDFRKLQKVDIVWTVF